MRFWPNGSGEPLTIPIDFLFCSLWNGVAFDDNEVVRIPFYLLTSITSATIDNSIAAGVIGPNVQFYTFDRSDFTDGLNVTGGIITKAKCPVIFWENNFNPRVVGFSDHLVCYQLVTLSPATYNTSVLYFIEEVRAEFINPTYTGGGGGGGGTGTTGPPGPPGSPGATGPTGSSGSPGEIGPIGETGATGETGPTGPQGTPGSASMTGATIYRSYRRNRSYWSSGNSWVCFNDRSYWSHWSNRFCWSNWCYGSNWNGCYRTNRSYRCDWANWI